MAKKVEAKRSGEPPTIESGSLRDRPLTADEMARARMGYAVWSCTATNTVSSGFLVAADPPAFPHVHLDVNHAMIKWRGETYVNVPLPAAEVLEFIVKQMPRPAGLKAAFGPHPERALKDLPDAIKSHLKMLPGKGYIFQP